MKRCLKCNLDYFDEMLEFCLEDGARLVSFTESVQRMSNTAEQNNSETIAGDTFNLHSSNVLNKTKTGDFQTKTAHEKINAETLREKASLQSYKILEVAPIVLSLAHNWWQWVYLRNQYYTSFSSYVFSANFLMWLLLLAAGAIIGLLAVRLCRNRGFAYTSLVVLAVNLLLFLVPKQ